MKFELERVAAPGRVDEYARAHGAHRALNIGYDLGILSPRIFTMLVIMALTTTMLTGSLLTLFGGQPVLANSPQEASRA